LSDTKVYEPSIRALLETAPQFYEIVVLSISAHMTFTCTGTLDLSSYVQIIELGAAELDEPCSTNPQALTPQVLNPEPVSPKPLTIPGLCDTLPVEAPKP
jgi:hypothetical protein